MSTAPRLSPDVASRHYRVHVIVAMTLYLATLLICVKLIQATSSAPLHVILALIPTLPVIWVMWCLYLFLTRADELQRRVHLTALSVAAGVAAVLTLTYGFLEQFAGFPHIAAWWTFVLIDVVWGAVSSLLFRRYK